VFEHERDRNLSSAAILGVRAGSQAPLAIPELTRTMFDRIGQSTFQRPMIGICASAAAGGA